MFSVAAQPRRSPKLAILILDWIPWSSAQVWKAPEGVSGPGKVGCGFSGEAGEAAVLEVVLKRGHNCSQCWESFCFKAAAEEEDSSRLLSLS